MNAFGVVCALWIAALAATSVTGWYALEKVSASRRDQLPKLLQLGWMLAIVLGLVASFLPGGEIRWQALTLVDGAVLGALLLCVAGYFLDSRLTPWLAAGWVARAWQLQASGLEAGARSVSPELQGVWAWLAGFVATASVALVLLAAALALLARALSPAVKKSEILAGGAGLVAALYGLLTLAAPDLLDRVGWLGSGLVLALVAIAQIRNWLRVESREVRVLAGLFGAPGEKTSWGDLIARMAFVALAPTGILIAAGWTSQGGAWLGGVALAVVLGGWGFLLRADAWRASAEAQLPRMQTISSGLYCALVPVSLLALLLEWKALDYARGMLWPGTFRHLAALFSVAFALLAFGARFSRQPSRAGGPWPVALLWAAALLGLYRWCGPIWLLGL